VRSTAAGAGKCGGEQPASGRIILVAVILGANGNMLVLEQAQRDGDVRRAARQRKNGWAGAGDGGARCCNETSKNGERTWR
jgi:hypothetical protein